MTSALVSSGLGLIVGIILALTGAGGAILAVPLLVFGMHLTMIQAGPPALLAVALSAAIGAMLGLRAGLLRYKAAGLIAAVGVICSPLGLWAAHRVPNAPLTLVFAVVLGLVAVRMFLQARNELAGSTPEQRRTPPPCLLDPSNGRLHWTARCARVLASSGALAGFLSGLLGLGGGFVVVPALRRFTDLEMRSVVATSLAVIALVSAGGVAAAALSGHVEWDIALPFATGAIVGMLGGRVVASRIKGPRLQQAFAVVSGLIALGMLALPLWNIVTNFKATNNGDCLASSRNLYGCGSTSVAATQFIQGDDLEQKHRWVRPHRADRGRADSDRPDARRHHWLMGLDRRRAATDRAGQLLSPFVPSPNTRHQ